MMKAGALVLLAVGSSLLAAWIFDAWRQGGDDVSRVPVPGYNRV
jgi:hypothetical protein